MGEYLDVMAKIDENEGNVREDEGMEDCGKVNLHSFIDDSIQDNNSPDYYSFTNVTRYYSSAGENAFFKSDILNFLDDNLKMRKYYVNSDTLGEEEEDAFSDSQKYVEHF